MGYGKGAKVLEPQELVDLVKDEIKEMGKNYD
jgi:predicted DNA-binding transcriptional regulator YafY